MTNEAKNDAWATRFGVLEDVTDRESAKGPYVTFKLVAKTFTAYGACFDEKVIKQMKDAVGQRVWMKGPVETRMVDTEEGQKERKSFKAIYFSVSDKQDGEAASEAPQAASETGAAASAEAEAA